MSTSAFSTPPLATSTLARSPREQPETPLVPLPTLALRAEPSSFASLVDDPAHALIIESTIRFCEQIGVRMEHRAIPATLARRGTVGRIGVANDAVTIMSEQRVVIGATIGQDPLAPVPRLWRGLQRRADVLVDLRQCATLPESAASRAGNERDVLLFSQRIFERPTRDSVQQRDAAEQWARARQAAELAFRLAAAENRTLLVVIPVGRGTDAQRMFSDALERHARMQRTMPPRTVKAGLLSALLSGDGGRERWLVASVMPVDELTGYVDEAIGDTGPWPVLSLGHSVSFYDMPQTARGAADPLPFLLVLVSMLQRSGRPEIARTLLHAAMTTTSAATRMREELGTDFPVPVDVFLAGVLANWGRAPLSSGRERRRTDRAVAEVPGLRLRVETKLSSADLRDVVSRALKTAGLEVASVRSVEGLVVPGASTFDVRIRSQLGEPVLGDSGALVVSKALSGAVRIIAVDPWQSAPATERPRMRA
jgi:hypothetical protein